MTNEHIELVKKWLEGECFSAKVLEANCAAARDTSRAAHAAYVAADKADYWVKQYEELTNDK